MTAHLMLDRNGAIVVAGCDTPADTGALLRWIMPVLEQWPKQSWYAFISEKTKDGAIRAALMSETDCRPFWKDVDASEFSSGGAVCETLGGGSGLIIITKDAIATHVIRALEGLAARMACFATSDPLAKPFKRSFVSFGV